MKTGACYHIWSIANGGNAAFRIRRCFNSRSAANTAARRGVIGADDGAGHIERHTKKIVSQCYPECPCGKGRRECGKGNE